MNLPRKTTLIGVALLSFGLLAAAQGPPRGGPGGPGGFGMGPGAFGPGAGLMQRGWEGFLGGRGLRGQVVAGAPFSATAVTQSSHPLSDGDQTARSTSVAVARDAQGRTWAEVQLPAGRGATTGPSSNQVIYIDDPVARISYQLFPAKQQVMEHPYPTTNGSWARGGRGGAPATPGSTRPTPPTRPNVTVTSLGTSMIQGVSATGQSFTTVVPVGQEGNANPITIVRQEWYSAQLHLIVQASSNDPRTGQSSFTLQNLQLGAPDATLFTVPAGYTVITGRGGRGR